MAMGLYFVNPGFTAEKYDQAIKRLQEAGAGAPAGRLYHVALESEGEIQVFDIWESKEAFDAFGATLVPILNDLGVELKPPGVSGVHNIVEGAMASA